MAIPIKRHNHVLPPSKAIDIPIVSRKTKNDAKVLLTFITAFLIMTGLTEIQSANVIQINIIGCIILLIFGSLL